MINPHIESQALMIHRHKKTGQVDVTRHDVIETGDKFTLSEGRVFTEQDKRKLLESMSEDLGYADFIDGSILLNHPDLLVWYAKPRKDVMTIRLKDERLSLEKVPYPGIIFFNHGNVLRAFAYKGRKRPTLTTQIYHAPVTNVSSNGAICTGNAKVPSAALPVYDRIAQWEKFFFEASGSHTDIQSVKGVSGHEEMAIFWQGLLEESAFPSSKMVAKHCTLRDLIRGAIK